MATLIDRLDAALQGAGFNSHIWKESRIYLKGYGKDISAYIEMDDPEAEADEETPLYEGCALKVFTNAEQGREWKRNRAKQVRHEIMKALAAAKIVNCEPCATWQEVIL